MFNVKKSSLYATKKNGLSKNANIFEKEMFKEEHRCYSENGSVKLTTTGNPILDDFAKLGQFRAPRDIQDIFNTMETLYHYDPLLSVKELAYLRMITRDTKFEGEVYKASRGQGLRAEYLGRLMWLAINHRSTFEKNFLLFLSIGSWQDFFDLLELDLSYVHNGRNHALDWEWMISFLRYYIQDSDHTNLIKKYLPQIKPAKRCTTLHSQCTNYIAKKIAQYLFEGEKDKVYSQYRHLKASGTAHQWQQAISRKDYSHLNFNAIAGRALQKLTNSKFLENNHLEQMYEDWLEKQPVAKFTGYPYELFKPIKFSPWDNNYQSNLKKYQISTLNKQFLGLVETAKQNMNRETNFICCIDTSGSMTAECTGTGVSAMQVAKSMALYFSYLLDGPFKNTFLEFESTVRMHKWTGSTPYEKYLTRTSGYCGSTNFLDIAQLFVELKRKGYNEKDFPNGVISISDGEFNGNSWSFRQSGQSRETIFEKFKEILCYGGFSKKFVNNFKLVLWDVDRGQGAKFETLGDTENFFHIGGLDPASIAFLMGVEYKEKPTVTPKTPEELMEAALSQDILEKIEL